MTGRIHSIQTLSGVDGPGMRCVVFLQGCPLRCLYCQNPDTWPVAGGTEIDAAELARRVLRCQPYFGPHGGVTLSGGEPLLQADFAGDVFAACRAAGAHTCIDTSGCAWNDAVRRLLDVTDLVLLDVKDADAQRHRRLTGADLSRTLEFLDRLAAMGKLTWVRQVIVPGWNDTPADVRALASLLAGRTNVRKAQLLAYHGLARRKYAELGLEYPLADTPEMEAAKLAQLQGVLDGLSRRPPSR
jgi:pyruvate formate lyase activating enzyme